MEGTGNIFYVIFTLESLTEYGMGYVLIHALLGEKISIKWSHIMAILTLFLITCLGIFLNEGSGIDSLYPPIVVALMVTVFFMMMAKLFFRKQWVESFFLGVYTNLLVLLIFIVVGVPYLLLMNPFDLNFYFLFVGLYLTLLSTAIFLYKKAPLNKLYRMTTQKTLSSTLLNRTLLFLFLVLLFIIYHNDRQLNFASTTTYIIGVFFIVVLITIPAIKNHLQQTKKEISNHDLYNDLLSTGIALERMEDVDEIKSKFKAHAERLGIELPSVDSSGNLMNVVSQQIERFIKLKQDQHHSEMEVITEIDYYKDHKTVDLQLLLQWLGTLLDNAIEASVTHPAYIRLMVTRSRLTLQVSNEYLGTDRENFEAWFTQGYSTKGGEGRGLGLYHLNETVTNLGGTLACFEEFNEVHRTSYLHLVIKFR